MHIIYKLFHCNTNKQKTVVLSKPRNQIVQQLCSLIVSHQSAQHVAVYSERRTRKKIMKSGELNSKQLTSDSRHLQADSRQASSALNSNGSNFGPSATGVPVMLFGSSLDFCKSYDSLFFCHKR